MGRLTHQTRRWGRTMGLPVTPVSPLRGLRVLLVEDEPLLAFEMIDELELLGAEPVGPLPSAHAALTFILGAESVDAAMINVNLRGQPSFDVADALLERGVPFVFVTGHDALVRERYPDVPCYPKPADMPKLVRALGRLVR